MTTQILHAIGSEWQNDATELQQFFDGLPDEDERAMMHADASDALFLQLAFLILFFYKNRATATRCHYKPNGAPARGAPRGKPDLPDALGAHDTVLPLGSQTRHAGTGWFDPDEGLGAL